MGRSRDDPERHPADAAHRPGRPAADPTRLILIYGGRSAEHVISAISARHVLAAADPARYEVTVIGITTAGRWIDATNAAAALPNGAAALRAPDDLVGETRGDLGGRPDPADMVRSLTVALGGGAALGGGTTELPVVFPILHGPMGEDGTIQGLLEMTGLPYVGAGVAGSAAAMDKGLAKALLASAGIPQAKYLALRAHQVDALTWKTVEAELGWPVFVKPANMGSSIGISQATDPDEFEAALELALRYDEYVVVEERIDAREIEVAVLGGPELDVSAGGEILTSREFYDYEDKYFAGTARHQIPADVPPEVSSRLARLARGACEALHVEGMARVDFFYEEATGRLLLNEINTTPGFTPISMYPLLWTHAGRAPGELLDALVDHARRRHDRRSRFATSYE